MHLFGGSVPFYSTLIIIALTASRARAARPDPFEGVSASSASATTHYSAGTGFFTDNFGFRKELMSEFATSRYARAYSRQSAGFEVLKKFSTETATVASLNFQGRLARRDRYMPVLNDMEGMHRPGWFFEHHNAYADLYNIAGPVGRFNVRAGRFYVPFGLNLQTDTHGSILQLSNERNFGFERDWYAGLWGLLNADLNYDVYYLAGSGYDLKYRGQSGLAAARLSLSNKYASENGLEAGVSALAGERLAPKTVETRRFGLDGRVRRPVSTGLFTGTAELSAGRDALNDVLTQLYQGEYLHASRRWGLAAQYRRFWLQRNGFESSLIAEAGWYLRNDVGNSNLHWIKLNVERRLEHSIEPRDVIVTFQYYRYW